MALKKTSKEEILKNSIKLFKIKGYHNTSMSNIADNCGLIKGSLYHHFKSKDDIGLEALRYIHQYFEKNIFSVAYNKKLNSKEKITLFIKKTDEYFLKSKGGCLLGNLALETSSSNKMFRDEILAYFNAWENALVAILEIEYDDETSLSFAQECVALTQGSIMMMNLTGKSENYLKIGKKLIKLF
ncbi:MAG: TetR/AcrR family transcriptional regulator [Campylobacteraceae bacterium]|nr:TetR/AcrR family transcriptional regulator [Campylobacteraceae bacterium]